jgi:phytoene dehydrogenase-like protein
MTEITIIGGGLAGLIAANTIAEQGGRAVLYEAGARLGGRARTETGDHRANFGPHALYFGAFSAWLAARDLLPPCPAPRKSAFKLAQNDRIRRLPTVLLPMLRSLKRTAPVDLDYRSWAHQGMSRRGAEAAIGFASLPTFHGDPGSLSAAFVHERLQRSFASPSVGYPAGGFASIVRALEARARELGIRIETGEKCSALPDGPVIVATDLAAARKLLDDISLDWPAPRTAMFDVSLEPRRRDRWAVLDLDRRVYVSDYSAYDPSLAPPGQHLIQGCAGLQEGETLEVGLERIHAVLDLARPDWRSRTKWKRQGLTIGGAGAADPPGTTWRDRPSINRGNDRWLAGDRVAAPGVLSEVAYASAVDAAQQALARINRTAPIAVPRFSQAVA